MSALVSESRRSQGLSPRITAIRCVCGPRTSRKMIVSKKAVVSAVFLIATLNKVPAKPQSSIIRERHIIHAPIKFRVIHHYKIKKVPIVVKKHLHYHHKPYSEKIRPILEEIHADHGYRHDSNGVAPQIDFRPHDDSKEFSAYAGIYLKDDSKASVPHHGGRGYSFPVQQENYNDDQEEEYEEVEDSRENYDDYE